MTTLVDHARRELALCGQTAEDPGYAAALVAAVAAFESYGHSGGSASMAIEQLARLLRYENLAPLTDDPDEWQDQSAVSGTPMWQNVRNGKAISYDGGRTYFFVDDPEPVSMRTSAPATVPPLLPSEGSGLVGGFPVPAEVADGYTPPGYDAPPLPDSPDPVDPKAAP